MKRSKPLQRKKPMRRRSKKMERIYAGPDGRRAVVARLLRERAKCEACPRIAAGIIGPDAAKLSDTALRQAVGCKLRAVDVHEVLPRSAGGSILDEDVLITTCRAGHDWIHHHPRRARELGLLVSRYAEARRG